MPDGLTPATPVGVDPSSLLPAPTTVTAVMVLCSPLGNVLTCTRTLVFDPPPLADDSAPDGVMVRTPPPIVETTTRPFAFVLEMTSPVVREGAALVTAAEEVSAGNEVDAAADDTGTEERGSGDEDGSADVVGTLGDDDSGLGDGDGDAEDSAGALEGPGATTTLEEPGSDTSVDSGDSGELDG